MSGASGLSSSELVLGRPARKGWWLVEGEEDGPGRIVEGPFTDRTEAEWAAGASEHAVPVRPAHGTRRDDGTLSRRPSPEDWAWLSHVGEQLERLPEGWDGGLSDDDTLTTLVVEVTAALAEAGLPLYDATGTALGGTCLTPEPALGGIVVTWRQHDRMSVDRVHGAAVDTAVQQVMGRALAEVLLARGFAVDAFGKGAGHVVSAVQRNTGLGII